ncbi:MAG: hypothetical protein V3T17_19305 [Pseudomonadales bacterium]
MSDNNQNSRTVVINGPESAKLVALAIKVSNLERDVIRNMASERTAIQKNANKENQFLREYIISCEANFEKARSSMGRKNLQGRKRSTKNSTSSGSVSRNTRTTNSTTSKIKGSVPPQKQDQPTQDKKSKASVSAKQTKLEPVSLKKTTKKSSVAKDNSPQKAAGSPKVATTA